MSDMKSTSFQMMCESGNWIPQATFCTMLSNLIHFAGDIIEMITENSISETLDSVRDLNYVLYQMNRLVWDYDDVVNNECLANAEYFELLREKLTQMIQEEDKKYAEINREQTGKDAVNG